MVKGGKIGKNERKSRGFGEKIFEFNGLIKGSLLYLLFEV